MNKLAEFIIMNEEAAKSALEMGRDASAAAEVAAEADRGLAEAAIEAAAATHALADAQAAAIAKKLEEAAAARAAAAADRDLGAAAAGVVRAATDIGDASRMTADDLRLVNEGLRGFAAPAHDADAAAHGLSAAMLAVRPAAEAASLAFSATDRAVAGSARAAGAATGFWARWGNVIHWVAAGSVEFLAVAVPAVVAFGAAMLVGMQGAQMMQLHLQALWTAAEATGNVFHTTMGQALGLKSVLQQAQDAANPHIYALLGAGLGIVKEQARGLTQAGSQVILVFDRFAARLQYDFSKAGGAGQTMHTLLKAMVPDLIMFGQVFGNIGHAVANFASKMPGLAEVLLKILDVFSRVLLWVSKLPTPLIMTAMAMEEIWRWGVPLVAILTKLPGAVAAFTASGFGLIPVGLRIAEVFKSILLVIPTLIADLAKLAASAASGTVFEGLTAGVSGFTERVVAAIAAMTVFEALAGVAIIAAIVGIGIALDRTRSATQQFVDSWNKMIASAKNINVMGYIATDFQTATTKMAANEAQLRASGSAMTAFAKVANAPIVPLRGVTESLNATSISIGHSIGTWLAGQHGVEAFGRALVSFENARGAAQNIDILTAAEKQQVTAMGNVSTGMGYLQQKYHVTAQGALELADAAGVKLASGLTGAAQAAVINRIMIEQLVNGYRAMGQSAGEVGTDMTALAIQSGLAASKVSQMNQAWDQFMQGLTGGTAGLASFNIGIQNMGQVVASAKNNLSKYTGSMSENVNAFAQSLKSFSGKGAAAWQQFDQVVGSTAPQMIDWLRQAGAEGALGANGQEKFSRAVADISAKLAGFASASKPAQAELMGLASAADHNITSWPQFLKWMDKTKGSAGDLGKIFGGATSKMEDMGAVAQKLGDVMNSSLAKMMDAVKLKAFGVQDSFQKLGDALSAIHPNSALIAQRFQATFDLLKRVFGPAQATQLAKAFTGQFGYTIKNGMVVPIKNAKDAGQKAGQGVADGLNSTKGSVLGASHNIFNAATSGVAPLPAHLRTTGSKSGQGMHDGLASHTASIASWGKTVVSDINASLGGLPGDLVRIGVSAVEGFIHGLLSMGGSIISAASSLGSEALSALKSSLHIGSPSRAAMEIGGWVAQGLAMGITNGLPEVQRASHKLADVIPGGLAIGTNGVPLAWEAEKIGKDTIRQLIKGLTGNLSQVKKAMTDIMTTLHKAIADGMAHGDMSALQRRHDLMLAVTLGQDNKKLQALANERQKIMNQIKKAEQYAASVTSSIRGEAGLGNLTQPTDPKTGNPLPWTPDSIQSGLTGQLNKMKAFDHNIDVLKKMHLDKHLIAQIVAMGYQQGGAMAEALAHESEAQIKALNKTEKAILAVSKKIGKDAADAMYDSGKNAGKGFLAGLKSQEKAIEHEMRRIADIIVKAIRKALRSKSPSMEMHDVGMDAAHGLALGLADGTPMVLAAAAKMAAAVAKVKVHVPSPVTGGHLMLPPLRGGGPGGGAPVVIVHQHIAGSVLAEQQLQQYMQTGVLKYTHRNSGNGMYLPGRASGAPVR